MDGELKFLLHKSHETIGDFLPVVTTTCGLELITEGVAGEMTPLCTVGFRPSLLIFQNVILFVLSEAFEYFYISQESISM